MMCAGWSLPISFVYTHAHYISTPIAADRYCTHIMVACHVVYHARNDTLSHAGEDTKEHYREARRVGKRAGSSGKRPHAMRSCAFLKPATVLPHCPHLQCTLSPAPTWPTLILAIAWDPQEASSRNSFSGCLVRAHGAWGSAGCMGECRLHGRVQDAWESAGCQVRVQGARESARCMGECRVHRRVQGALESAGCQVQVQGAWESTACVGKCRVHRRVPGGRTLTEPNPD